MGFSSILLQSSYNQTVSIRETVSLTEVTWRGVTWRRGRARYKRGVCSRLNSSVIRRRPKRTNIHAVSSVAPWLRRGVTSMTKAGQTCLTTCKIPMNERNLLFGSLWWPAACVRGSRFRESVRESKRACERASERLRPRPLLNSSTSRSRDTHGLCYSGIKGEDHRCHVTPAELRFFPHWSGEQRSKIHRKSNF